MTPNPPPCHDTNKGPGYASPAEAIKGPREKIIFVTCASTRPTEAPDALATVDVDPESSTYCQVIGKVQMPFLGDEVHHSGWNVCSSCHGCKSEKRTHLILPCLNSSRIYAVNTEDPRNLKISKTITTQELAKFDLSFPHTAHCLADGNIMVNTLGDAEGNHKCDFLLIDNKTFAINGTWGKHDIHNNLKAEFAYDFWYQPKYNVMISSEWGAPNKIMKGFNPRDVKDGFYGNSLNIYDWKEHKLIQQITLDEDEGWMPLEVRFKHDPLDRNAFVCTGLGSSVYHIYFDETDNSKMKTRLIIRIPPKRVEKWILPTMAGLVTDILLSMDDRFLYLSNWAHGDIRMYDIQDPYNVHCIGQVFIGGSIHKESGVTVKDDPELKEAPDACYVKGKKIEGGPQMLQLSLDGKRLYVTTSLYQKWDDEFYPGMIQNGAFMLQIDVNTDLNQTCPNRLRLNTEFIIGFDNLFGNGIPYLCHEMRYPGGDCTSDIFLARE